MVIGILPQPTTSNLPIAPGEPLLEQMDHVCLEGVFMYRIDRMT